MRSQRKAHADRIKNPATTEPATLDPHRAMAPPLRARRQYGMTRSSDRRNFENAAISGRQFYPEARTLRLSTRDRCELFCPLLASSIITKPDLLPVGFAWPRRLAGGALPPAFFCLEYASLSILRRRSCLWSSHGRRLRVPVRSASRRNSKRVL